MNKYFYDFHVHSCLSPCADDDMTPASIAGMASLVGINIMALTDHNSVKNCPAFYKAAAQYGIVPIAGMELTTAEDIHVVCLFEELRDALSFGEEIDSKRTLIKNRTDIFGNQLIVDENDNILGTEENLLPNAVKVSLDDVPKIVAKYNGICYPAHIDRPSNGIIAALGTFPESPDFSCAEINDSAKIEEYVSKYPVLESKNIIVSSDAHYLWNIRDENMFIELDDEPYSSALVRKRLFYKLRCAK